MDKSVETVDKLNFFSGVENHKCREFLDFSGKKITVFIKTICKL